MPAIICAAFLGYRNAARNSDKLFHVFLVDEQNGNYSCVTEYGRRGHNLVRQTVYSGPIRADATSKFNEKIRSKRFHRETPYELYADGERFSEFARAFSYPYLRALDKPAPVVRKGRMLNGDQFDSLEF